jgi:hypothetical protein
LNNKYRLWKVGQIEKPCHKCGFCPYGQLVEEFPIYEKAKVYARKHNLWVKWIETPEGRYMGRWEKCDKNDPEKTEDLNVAVELVDDPYSCQVFGHNCPIYYCGEMVTEKGDKVK